MTSYTDIWYIYFLRPRLATEISVDIHIVIFMDIHRLSSQGGYLSFQCPFNDEQ